MRYVSTRGAAPELGFADALLAGLARDGGLYVPQSWPSLPAATFHRLSSASYEEAALEVMAPFVEPSMSRDELAPIVESTYATFDDPEVVPLRRLSDGIWLAELFHGPTLAFKDVALQLVGRLFDHELHKRGERITIVGATSGDTGSAAIEACRDRDAIDIFILHPAGRVSEVQRRQMTTVLAPNVHNIAVEGTFDDCQDLTKALFGDADLRDRRRLSAVNSINWARVMAQIVYYVRIAAQLRASDQDSPPGSVAFSVPTGNFGNVFAGHGARRMGTSISELLVASNRNDILTRLFTTGTMAISEVHPTLSPSMDIQVSSNFERLLFELLDRDGPVVGELLEGFRSTGSLTLDPSCLDQLRQGWVALRLDDTETAEVIARTYESDGVLVDPHTAVGLGAARSWLGSGADPGGPVVTLATAHPAKFPDAVEAATGVRPPLPARLADIFDRPERYVTLPNDVDAIRSHIEASLA